jgi:ABC-type nitrate/sulfonate/bicarbonate transport system permease component
MRRLFVRHSVVSHLSAVVRRSLLPILVVSQTVPTVVLAPVLAILLGFGIGPEPAACDLPFSPLPAFITRR